MMSEIVIFQHIAKTAGTSLGRLFASHFAVEQQLAVVPGSKVSALGTWPNEWVEDAWRKLSQSQQDAIRFVGGHLRFGVHAVLPRPARYVTLLRDPVDRVLSSFYYSMDRHFQNTGVRVSLEDYVFRKRHYDLGLNNYQTRVVSGLEDLDPFGSATTENSRELSESDLSIAMDNLRNHYLLVGTTEKMTVFVARLAKAMGWAQEAVSAVPRENATPNRPAVADVDARILAEIRRHNTFDIQLYSYAERLFEPDR